MKRSAVWLAVALLAASVGACSSSDSAGAGSESAGSDSESPDSNAADSADLDAADSMHDAAPDIATQDIATHDIGDGAAGCTSDLDCASDNPCLLSVCGVKGQCTSSPLEGKACDDGDLCTQLDACNASGSCVGTAIVIADDPCASCTCKPDEGVVCAPHAPGATCDDQDCCTANDRCRACAEGSAGCDRFGLTCAGDVPTCNDTEPCTTDLCTCVGGESQCEFVAQPDGTSCEYDPNVCTLGDQCQNGRCAPGVPAPLADGNPCTQDVCVKGNVEHIPQNGGQCDDGDECTIDDHCLLGNCVGGGQVSCVVPPCAGSVECVTGQGCVPSWLPEGASCSGDATCGAGFACNSEHECAPAVGKNCDDGNACTVDTCDDLTGDCLHTPVVDPCAGAGECMKQTCNPATGACDEPLPDGTPCSIGECTSGVCGCVPECGGMECGSDGCGGTCGECAEGEACANGQCGGCSDTCPTVCLPDGSCCPPGGFCPKSDTSLSGEHAFDVVYIPEGVTVNCVGNSPLRLQVSGDVWVQGALRADGMDALSGSGFQSQGSCGGFAGGDGFRSCTSSASTFCETTAASTEACLTWISPKETVTGPACSYLANGPGGPGDGPGGGFGGAMAHPIHNAAPGSGAGGGGGSYTTPGQMGVFGAVQTAACAAQVPGGAPGPTVSSTGDIPPGGSGGGAGGLTRAGACGTACPLGCTAWGGDGGAGGGVIVLSATGNVDVTGAISARGGSGAQSGGATCGGGGGGGAGGAIKITANSVTTANETSAHLIVSGGAGGPMKCPGLGQGGVGGKGALLIQVP